MKKFLSALLIASATLLSFSSCTKEYINNYEESRTQTFNYTVRPNDWSGQGANTLRTELNVPELNDDYVDYGLVNLSISFDNKQSYTKLPAVVDGISYNYDYTTSRVVLFAQDPINDNLAINISDILYVKVSLTEGW